MHHPLEIHVAIDPTPPALNRLRYLAASLAMYGGHLGGSPLVVTVGGEPTDLDAALPWARSLAVEWRFVDPELYARWGAAATSLSRFGHDFSARHVLFLESDLLVVAPVAELVKQVLLSRAFSGAAAVAAPDGLAGDDPTALVFDPAVLAAPQGLVRRLAGPVMEALESATDVDPDWRIAAAVSRAVAAADVPTEALARRFNFINDRTWMTRFHADALDIRFFRYCHPGQLDREADFASPEAVDAMLMRTGWDEANTALTLRLNRVHHYVQARLAEQREMGVPELLPIA